jgi:hypothetical protein
MPWTARGTAPAIGPAEGECGVRPADQLFGDERLSSSCNRFIADAALRVW